METECDNRCRIRIPAILARAHLSDLDLLLTIVFFPSLYLALTSPTLEKRTSSTLLIAPKGFFISC